MIILYSALRAVPAELFDAAEVDGAGPIRVAWSIKIPAIRQAILLTVIFSIIGSFQLFSEPSILGVLAPNSVGSDFSPNLYAYNVAFVNQDVGYSAAIAFVLGLIIMVISYVVQTATNRSGDTE
jgi:multiple sugar transport system permease protein